MDSSELGLFGLVEDVRLLIAKSYLDLPSRLSLALASRAAYASFWDSNLFKYNCHLIMDECARRGYRNLLEFAYQSGAMVDGKVLLCAVESGNLELAKWLLPKCATLIPSRLKIRICHALAQTGNLDLCRFVFSGASSIAQGVDLSCLFTYYGHPEVFMELFPKEPKPHYFYAARSGRFDLVLRLSSGTPNLGEILGGALGGHASLDLIRYAIEKGATLDDHPDILQVSHGFMTNLEVLKYLYEKFPESVESAVNCFFSHLIVKPRIEVLNWILDTFPTVDVPAKYLDRLLLAKVHSYKIIQCMEDAYDFDKYDHQERLECAMMLMKRMKLTYTAATLGGLSRWATLDEMKFLVEHLPKLDTPSNRSMHVQGLTRYFQTHLVADNAIVRFLLANGSEINNLAIFHAAQMVNSLDILNFMAKEAPERVKEVLQSKDNHILELLMERFSQIKQGGLHVHSEVFFEEKLRIRVGKMMDILGWLLAHGATVSLTIKPESLESAQDRKGVSRPTFLEEFRSMGTIVG